MFRSLARAILLDENQYSLLRQQTVEHLRSHEDFYCDYLDSPETFPEYLEHLAQEGTYAGYPCLVAISRMFSIRILVYQSTGPTYKIDLGMNKTVELAYYCSHYDLIETIEDSPDIRELAGNQMESDAQKSLEILPISKLVELISSSMTQKADSPQEISLIDLKGEQLLNEDTAIQFLKRFLIPSENCPNCAKVGRESKLAFRPPYAGHKFGLYYCTKCKSSINPLVHTMLYGSRMSVDRFLITAIGWLMNLNYKTQLANSHLSERALSTLNLRLNIFARILVEKSSQKIGGYLKIVEIDEALLHRRKYQKGRLKESGWVLGGIERPSQPGEIPKLFLEACPNRRRATLEEIIQKNVLPGTIIVTDSFKSYCHLHELGYYHYAVNHKRHFVDPTTLAHTQRIEGIWKQIRSSGLPATGCNLEKLDLYLAGYMYRRITGMKLETFMKDLCSVSYSDVVKRELQWKHQIQTEDETDEESYSEENDEEHPSTTEASSQQPAQPLPVESDANQAASQIDWTQKGRAQRRMVRNLDNQERINMELLHDTRRAASHERKLQQIRTNPARRFYVESDDSWLSSDDESNHMQQRSTKIVIRCRKQNPSQSS